MFFHHLAHGSAFQPGLAFSNPATTAHEGMEVDV